MRIKQTFEAVVTVQRAELDAQDLVARDRGSHNPFVQLLILVPKGKNDVAVPTDCVTHTLRRAPEPIWNRTFSLPVLPESDVLVFQMFHDPRPARTGNASESIARSSSPANVYLGSPPPEDTDSVSHESTHGELVPADAPTIGLCLLPIAHFSPDGEVTTHALEIFPRPDEPPVGTLFIAAKVRSAKIELLEKKDLHESKIIAQYHVSRLSAVDRRFLGIGELAIFLFEDGYSHDMDENWERAVTLLAEQLAYRIWETTGHTDDTAIMKFAKRKVIKDGGLWDGV